MSSDSTSPVPCSGGYLSLVWPMSQPKQSKQQELTAPDWELSLNQWTPTRDIVQKGNFHLVHLGRRLDPHSTMSLKRLGIHPGSTIYVMPKPPKLCDDTSALGSPPASSGTDSSNAEQFAMALSMALGNPALKAVVAKLKDKETVQSLWVACPSLQKDPVALALLQRPETLLSLLRPEGYKQTLKSHPALIHAAENLMAAVHEEERETAGTTSTNPSSSSSSGQSSSSRRHGMLASLTYHLDTLSDGDDEDDDDEAMDDMPAGGVGADGNPLQRNTSFSVITPNQLAAAIAAASTRTDNNSGSSMDQGSSASASSLQLPPLAANASGMSSASSTAPPTASVPGSNSSNITDDMFQQAMQQAMRASASMPSGGNSSQESAASNEDLSEKIANIVEMGVADAELARRALLFVRGDTQAAIDVILGGWKPLLDRIYDPNNTDENW